MGLRRAAEIPCAIGVYAIFIYCGSVFCPVIAVLACCLEFCWDRMRWALSREICILDYQGAKNGYYDYLDGNYSGENFDFFIQSFPLLIHFLFAILDYSRTKNLVKPFAP